MVYNLSKINPLVGEILAELRDTKVQQNRAHFRSNLERLGGLFASEISKKMPTIQKEITTPLGIANCTVLEEQPVVASILRAGVPMHNGLLHFFGKADSAFIAAYRHHHKSGKFTIKLEYLSCPNLEDRILILADPMLATGASMVLAIKQLLQEGVPKHIHVATAIACTVGVEHVRRNFGDLTIWAGDIDEELTAKGYIVPGLGDAGDLAYGLKVQD